MNRKITLILALAGIVVGCAVNQPKQFQTLSSNTYDLKNAPKLDAVVKQPVADISKVYLNAWYASAEKTKEKFESDGEFQARVEKASKIDNAFIVKNLETNKCTNYDFKTGSYDINCWGIKPSNLLMTKSKSESKIVANKYRTRKVDVVQKDNYYLAANVFVKQRLSVSVEDAKKLDSDLMVGVLIKPADTSSKRSGCSEYDLTYNVYGSNACNEIAMDTGMALLTYEKTVGVAELLEMVVYRKSDNKVLIHEIYTPSN